ncbi:hypothetical protein M3Y97_01010700 [Aphelenchoides bicaudatus]|nr:hypothetical protein M3Y97_01010700 [Aphelenchoides bicaudatus]
MADKKKPAKGISKPTRVMAKKMIGSGVVQKILLKKALECEPSHKSSDAAGSSAPVQIFEKEASEKAKSAKVVEEGQKAPDAKVIEESESQKQVDANKTSTSKQKDQNVTASSTPSTEVAKEEIQKPLDAAKTSTSSTQTVEEEKQESQHDASIDHLLELAKEKLMENEDAGLVCALCRNDFEKPQIVGAVLDKIRQLNNDPKKTNIYDIWLCRDCFIDYSCKINTMFKDFFSNEWILKGKPEQGPDIDCVFQTVTSVIVLRVNDVKITFNDVEYLLFNGGKPLKDEADGDEEMEVDENKDKTDGDAKQ